MDDAIYIERIEKLAGDKAQLRARLGDVIRICEAVRYTAGLGKGQVERLERAKAIYAETAS